MNCIITRADENIKEITDLTLPYLEMYAKYVGADFHIISEKAEILTADRQEHYRILHATKLFEKYDRILNIDADTLVLPHCPNIFDIVPKTHIGAVCEDVLTRQDSRRRQIQAVQLVWGSVGWQSGLINGGVFVWSKQHKNILNPVKGEYWLQFGSAQVHIGYNIAKYNHRVCVLPSKFNHMNLFGDRKDAYIIHYAGTGFDDRPKHEQIKEDIETYM